MELAGTAPEADGSYRRNLTGSWPEGMVEGKPSERQAPHPTPRDLVRVALWGGLTAGVAYGLARGSLPVAVLLMLLFGVAQRLVAVRIVRARGQTPPRWWWK